MKGGVFSRIVRRVATWSRTGESGSANLSSTPRIVAEAVSAGKDIADRLRDVGFRTDFTLCSLYEIDRLFDRDAPAGVARPGGLFSENVGFSLFALGGYVGLTLLRELGGEWVGDDRDPEGEINISLKLSDGSIVWPVQRIMMRFRDGAEYGVGDYGAVLGRSFSASRKP
ncbi:hypothetical protein [Sphingopyxis sp. JAI128]|uniref:hypothetical protein n=1 Tax=Sphingopyxis sp. JAI128 TaxID=2723066 RepID=UPI0016101581|nr:hypothetical protein [Sphingopyxis sp. JAI128]MBB6426892.1 hypothetical protein [Sphingopyxis sp. JAI128]